MLPKNTSREGSLERIDEQGGLRPGSLEAVHRATGVPEADLYGVATFYSLLRNPDAGVHVCQGLSCKLAGSDELFASLTRDGTAATLCACWCPACTGSSK